MPELNVTNGYSLTDVLGTPSTPSWFGLVITIDWERTKKFREDNKGG